MTQPQNSTWCVEKTFKGHYDITLLKAHFIRNSNERKTQFSNKIFIAIKALLDLHVRMLICYFFFTKWICIRYKQSYLSILWCILQYNLLNFQNIFLKANIFNAVITFRSHNQYISIDLISIFMMYKLGFFFSINDVNMIFWNDQL